MYEIMIIITNR